MKEGDIINGKRIAYKITEDDDPREILCTTYQMRNFFKQFKDGFFSNLDVMNYIQHLSAAKMAKKNMNILDVCCGRSLMLPLLRYQAKDINEYIGVDISDKNLREARRWSGAKNLEKEGIYPEYYYPFQVTWIQANVAEMSNHIVDKSIDFAIYTSAIEHMHKEDGLQSLKECYKVMKDNAFMFLSCPNTPGNGYDTQYSAHVYEWGYQELKDTLHDIGFKVTDEFGLVSSVKDLDEYIEAKGGEDLKEFYYKAKRYMPSEFLTSMMPISFPEMAKEILFIVEKDKQKRLF